MTDGGCPPSTPRDAGHTVVGVSESCGTEAHVIHSPGRGAGAPTGAGAIPQRTEVPLAAWPSGRPGRTSRRVHTHPERGAVQDSSRATKYGFDPEGSRTKDGRAQACLGRVVEPAIDRCALGRSHQRGPHTSAARRQPARLWTEVTPGAGYRVVGSARRIVRPRDTTGLLTAADAAARLDTRSRQGEFEWIVERSSRPVRGVKERALRRRQVPFPTSAERSPGLARCMTAPEEG